VHPLLCFLTLCTPRSTLFPYTTLFRSILPRASVSMLNRSEFERWCTGSSGRDCDLLLLSVVFGSSPEDPQSPGLALLRRLREQRSEEHTSELQSHLNLVCRLLLEKKKN